MFEYHKIDSVFKRDPYNNYKTFLEGEWTRPEFGFLSELEWLWTEKIDGTNIRFTVGENGPDIRGRTDRAQIPAPLLEELVPIATEVTKALPELVFVGEGYGPGIQKGDYYRSNPGFILFDVFTPDGMALDRPDQEDIASQVGLDIVPVIGRGTLWDAIDLTEQRFESVVASDSQPAEGLVLRPRVELRCRDGRRVITKLKSRDFPL